tara:strand:+ start:119 stop:706 length:588 start_codon:yes stop_codon:yes gene_type:complete
MERQLIFPSELWKTKLNIDNQNLSKFILDLEKNTKNNEISNVGGWQSKADFIFKPELSDLRDKIFKTLIDVAKTNAYKENVSFVINNGWANVNRHKDYNTSHQHPLSYWSGVYYVKVPANSGDLYFMDPKTYRTMIVEYPFVKNFNNPSQTNHIALKPEEGGFVLFPSYMEHLVRPNLSNEPRISIAINFGLKND